MNAWKLIFTNNHNKHNFMKFSKTVTWRPATNNRLVLYIPACSHSSTNQHGLSNKLQKSEQICKREREGERERERENMMKKRCQSRIKMEEIVETEAVKQSYPTIDWPFSSRKLTFCLLAKQGLCLNATKQF